MPQLEPLTVRNQFPDYPIDALPDLTGFEDTSWHNDTCPSFRKGQFLVWVDWPCRCCREDTDGYRFVVCRLDEEECPVDGPVALETEDWAEVLSFVN